MGNNLYDTGAPKRIIVQHEHKHSVEVQVSTVLCQDCGLRTRTVPCEFCGNQKKKRSRVELPRELPPAPAEVIDVEVIERKPLPEAKNK